MSDRTCRICRGTVKEGDSFCGRCGGRQEAWATLPTGTPVNEVPTPSLTCFSCSGALSGDQAYCPSCGEPARPDRVAGSLGDEDEIRARLVEATRGRYHILHELGRGGMGYVYLGRDVELDRFDAIKVLMPSLLTQQGMVERFRREARTIAKLRHPSIVNVHAVGASHGLHYFAMEYLDGTSLRRILDRTGMLSIESVTAVLYQVGSALDYAHRTLVHRDVKPSNVMLTRDGRVIVTDFGIAKVAEAPSGLTATGVIMGTPEYMSPEQCKGGDITTQIDQYALGAVTFAMLTGIPPFSGQWIQVVTAHMTQPVPSVRSLRPDCPETLASTVERMLAKSPAERWPTIGDAIRHLGLRPLTSDDRASIELARLVERTLAAEEAASVPASKTEPPYAATPTVQITAPGRRIEPGDVIPLNASVFFSDGSSTAGRDLSWQSTDPSVARVTPSGDLVAVGVGAAEITAAHRGASGTLSVVVAPRAIASLTVAPQETELRPGESIRLEPLLLDKRGDRLDRRLAWSSDAPQVVEVTDDGVATALEIGATDIHVRCDRESARVAVHVSAPSATQSARREMRRGGLSKNSNAMWGAGLATILVVGGGIWWGTTRQSDPEPVGASEIGVAPATPDLAEAPDPEPAARVGAGDQAADTAMTTPALQQATPAPQEATPGPADGTPETPTSAAAPPAAGIDDAGADEDAGAGSAASQGGVASQSEAASRAEVTDQSDDEGAEEEPAAEPLMTSVRVIITNAPWANLFLDDAPRGQEENSYELTLASGGHTLRLEHPAFESFVMDMDPDTLSLGSDGAPPRLIIPMIRRQEKW